MLEYKETFIKSEALTMLVIHIADFFKIAKSKRFQAHYQMLELCLSLVRNLLSIRDHEHEESTHFGLIVTIMKQEILNPVLYLIQVKD